MGDLQTEQGEALELRFVPVSEFARLRANAADPVARTAAYAALARINALYMIARAGSGHVGSSFSCLDIVTWLYLYELRNPATPGGDQSRHFGRR